MQPIGILPYGVHLISTVSSMGIVLLGSFVEQVYCYAYSVYENPMQPGSLAFDD